MRKGVRTLVLILTMLFAASSFPSSAQIHKKVVRTAGFVLDSLQRRFLTKVDTNYIGNYTRPWRLSLMYNASHFRSLAYVEDYSLYVTTKMTNRLSFGIGYQGLAFNFNYRLGSKQKMEMSIQAYGRQMGVEIKFHGSDQINLEVAADGQDPVSVDAKGAELFLYLVDGYYAFNHRKFSYPAALSQSKVQKRSAGSILAGFSFSALGVNLVDPSDGQTASSVEGRLSLGVGYGYNWAFHGGKLLIHGSLIPMLNLLDRDLYKGKGEEDYKKKDTDRYSFVNLFRLGLFYNFSERLYAGILITENPVPKREQGYFTMDNSIFSRASITWRF